jgi:hypothetical protein
MNLEEAIEEIMAMPSEYPTSAGWEAPANEARRILQEYARSVVPEKIEIKPEKNQEEVLDNIGYIGFNVCVEKTLKNIGV